MRADDGLEAAIQERGRALLDGVEPERLIALTPAWWQEQMMEWAAHDPDFRVKLLRFVDVLPALRTTGAVADHVRQYFRDDAPPPVRMGSAIASARAFRPVLSRVVRAGVFAMAERFIGGATPEEALPALERLLDEGIGYTIDLLGEATLSEHEADVYQQRYIDLLQALTGIEAGGDPAVVQPNVSVKLSALTSHFEPAAPVATSAAVRERLVPVLRAARGLGAFVYIDMEQYRYRDLTHHVLADAIRDGEFGNWQDIGIVVQAYLKDAAGDIERLKALAIARNAPITVRLVKGAYWDEETVLAKQQSRESPVFEEKAATDANFERCTDALLDAYPALKPAFASHNPRSIAQAMVKVEQREIARADVEFQMLYGMAEGLRKAVKAQGYRTRVYVPSGEIIPGMAYLVRRLLENTSNESWLMHRHEEADADTALQPPVLSPPAEAEPDGRFRNHPPAEFYRAAHRERMLAALKDVRAAFGAEIPAVINGEPMLSREWEEVCPPAAPTTLMARVARMEPRHAAMAVQAAHSAFPAWRDTPASKRAAILRKAAGLIDARRWELAATMVYECAKPWREADGDVCEAIDFLRYYAGEAERLEAGVDLSLVPGETNRFFFEGRGVVAVIAPWNFPLAIITGMTAGALAGGCTAVVKPAEQSPIVASKMVAILHEAGVPPGAVHFLPGPGETLGPALVEDPDVAMVAFTGSNAVGMEIVERAGRRRDGQKRVKKVLAELGGKNAVIVDEDADLDLAVAEVVRSAFGYAGQKCSAASRVYVVGRAYEEFRERLGGAVESLVVGLPEDPFTVVPPVISAEAQQRIERYIEIGHTEGRLVAKGAQPEGGHYVAPHVFEGLPPSSALAREEVFGPVLIIGRARTFEHALQMALDSDYALTGGVFSRNPRHIREASRHFRVGNLYINRAITGSMVGRQPFAGFGSSGTGDKAGGPHYVEQFMHSRVVTENTMRRGFAPDA